MLTSFLVLAGLLFSLLGEYVTAEKEEVLRYTAGRINEMTDLLIESSNLIVERLYRMNIEAYASNTQSLILIVNQNGEIFISSASKNLQGFKLSNEQYGEVLAGNEIKRIGSFGGLFEQTVLTIGVPLIYNDEIIGGVFLNTPIPEINKVRYDLFYLFIISLLVAFMIGFLLIFFISQRFSGSLKKINRAAKTIANGNFENRVTVKSNDEIGELAQTFNVMAESLAKLEEMRKSFVANVSHELRTPMTTISGFIEGILDGTIPGEEKEKYLKIALNESRRMSRLVTNLLDLARIEARENELTIFEFDINELIRIVTIKFEKQILEKELHININFEDEQCFVIADSDSIERVLTNLIDNAVKFSNVGGIIEITIKTKGDKVYISVKDYGEGIGDKELKNIWDRFYKIDKSRSIDKLGTGLGLSIVKNIINQHNEEIWIKSEVGEFTEFTFTLKKAGIYL